MLVSEMTPEQKAKIRLLGQVIDVGLSTIMRETTAVSQAGLLDDYIEFCDGVAKVREAFQKAFGVSIYEVK